MSAVSDVEQAPRDTPTCVWEEYHDDMYREFAPEPIVVECEAPAQYEISYYDAHNPEGNVLCRDVMCESHFLPAIHGLTRERSVSSITFRRLA